MNQQPTIFIVRSNQVQQPIVEIALMPQPANGVRFPIEIICPYCMRKGLTKVSAQLGGTAFCWCCILLFIFFPIFWVPLILPDCRDIYSYCCYCNGFVGECSA